MNRNNVNFDPAPNPGDYRKVKSADPDERILMIESSHGYLYLDETDIGPDWIDKPAGTRVDGHLKLELRCLPTLKGRCGPMWGGADKETGRPIARYDTWPTHDILSR